jgi:hypothetical protein
VALGNRGSLARCLLIWSCATSAVTGAGRLTGPSLRAGVSALVQQRLDAVPLDGALTDLAAALLLGCAAWLWLGTSYVVLEALRGRAPGPERGPERGPGRSAWVPRGLRRLVLAACGTAIVGALAQPAASATADVGHPGRRPHTIVRSPVAGLPLPERAAVELSPQRVVRSSHRQPAGTGLVVAPGDTLWSIAARTLPAHSPDAVIARRWRAIYAANRGRIGADPDLIVPGLHLHLPAKDLP